MAAFRQIICAVFALVIVISPVAASQAPKHLSLGAQVSFAATGGIVHKAAFFKAATFRASGGGGSSTPFTALTTYFISPTGNDTNNGLTTSAPFLTMNHPFNCGDLIIAQTGTYNQDFATWGAVSNCPSTTGGIDGAGGIYFAVVTCSGNLQTCNINCSTAMCNGAGNGPSAGMNVENNNFAIEGFAVNGNGAGSLGFMADACLNGTQLLHHVAFINDIAYNAGVGFGANDCSLNNNVPGNGPDYWAAVGNMAQNANLIAICSAAIVNVGPANFDSNAGVHVYVAGNFAIANNNNPSCTASDGEGIMFDTWDAHGYIAKGVIENNIVYSSSWVGIQVFMQAFHSSSVVIDINHNTLYNNMQCPHFMPGSSGDINLQLDSNFPWTISTYNNISQTTTATQKYGATCASTATDHSYSMLTSAAGVATTITTGGSGLQNIFWGIAGTCDSALCDAGNNVIAYNSGVLGTNTYANPTYTNTTDLLTNWVSAPSCSAFASVARCMGWNGSGVNANSVISDLVPTAGGTSGDGYQTPTNNVSNSKFPTWLKGVVCVRPSGYVNGASASQFYDCAQTPPGL